ncbi:MAG: PRC-barrel domain-containing protein [Bacteroidota bacterium]
MALENNNTEQYRYDHLDELTGSDYEIVEGQPDIRGWDVKTEQGRKIGEIEELLFDPEARKVRYLVVDLQGRESDIRNGSTALIPIGVATLYSRDVDTAAANADGEVTEGVYTDPNADSFVVDNSGTANIDDAGKEIIYDPYLDGDVVIVPIDTDRLRDLPAYEKGNVTPATEAAIRRVFERGSLFEESTYNRNDFYNHDHFDVERFYDRGATTRSNLPVSEPSLDEPLDGVVKPPQLDGDGFNEPESDRPGFNNRS